jgi:hypothetical protein
MRSRDVICESDIRQAGAVLQCAGQNLRLKHATAEIARSYDSIAQQWLEPHLAANGIRQHEQALKFRPNGGRALDVGCGCSGRFPRS